jgi:hypothetical protein
MVSRLVRTEFDRKLLMRFIEAHKLPFTCDISQKAKRTIEQNRLQRLWMKEAAEQIDGNTSEELRGHCKLHIGVPILREENEDFRIKYDIIVKPLPYEHKLALMMEPLDFPVTRLMTTKQKTLYLDSVYQHFSEMGVALTVPLEGGERKKAA